MDEETVDWLLTQISTGLGISKEELNDLPDYIKTWNTTDNVIAHLKVIKINNHIPLTVLTTSSFES